MLRSNATHSAKTNNCSSRQVTLKMTQSCSLVKPPLISILARRKLKPPTKPSMMMQSHKPGIAVAWTEHRRHFDCWQRGVWSVHLLFLLVSQKDGAFLQLPRHHFPQAHLQSNDVWHPKSLSPVTHALNTVCLSAPLLISSRTAN